MSKEFKQTLRDHCMAKGALHAPLFMAFSKYCGVRRSAQVRILDERIIADSPREDDSARPS
jgi:hypothetical protein